MKKLIYLIALVSPLLFTACEDFLDANSYTTKNAQTFPKTEEDASQMLTGVYSTLNNSVSSSISTYFYAAELFCDDRFGGGGSNDKEMQSYNHLLYANRDQFSSFWSNYYTGIARANATLAALESMDESSTKAQKVGEAKFLRAFFYFGLVQLLGDVPLMKAAPENVQEAKTSPPQASQEEIFKQIGTDLWEAYSSMPSVKWNGVISGTATKWAAAGLLARAYLFYTGFYNKASLPIEGGQVTKEQVAEALKNAMDNSGHSLLKDYRSLWGYSNSVTKKDYPFAKDAETWVRDGQNPEHVFVIKMIPQNAWSSPTYSNDYSLHFGVRNSGNEDQYVNIFPLGGGWGAGPVNSLLWDEWLADEPTDIRRMSSIYNQEEEAVGEYYWGADSQVEETGMWQKKVIGTTAYGGTRPGGLFWDFMSTKDYYDRTADEFQMGHGTDLIMIRYADILLMHSEITKTVDGINAVRARVSLPPVAGYTENALRKERRYELAFEGLRWGDIRRWGIAEQVLGKMYGVPIRNMGVQTTMKKQGVGVVERYKATKGFYMIPQREIDLANGALKQNAGWGTDAIFNAWTE